MATEEKDKEHITVGLPIEAVELSVLQVDKSTKLYLRMHYKSVLTLVALLTKSLQEHFQEKTDE